jgi:hypothetical protein
MQQIGSSPEEFTSTIQAEIPRWAKIVQESRMKPAE